MLLSLIRNEKQYTRLFIAGIVNGIGDRFSSIAVLAMLLQLTGSGLSVGITLAIRLLPSLFFGPIGGWMADRFSRRTILVVTDLIRIPFAMSFILIHRNEDLWIVYLSSFILAAGEAIYGPVRKSGIPHLVNKEILVKVNSLEQVMVGIVLFIGALLGGIISTLFGANVVFGLNAGTFLGSAAIISTIMFPNNQTRKEEKGPKNEKRISTFKKVILMSVQVQVLFFFEILMASVSGIDNVLISVYAVNVYHLGDVGVGLFYGSLGIGLILSFSVANRLRTNFLTASLICLLFEGTFLVLLSQLHLLISALIMFLGAAFMSGIGNACLDTILMKEIPQEHQGMMFGLLATIGNTILGISMFISGFALQYLHPRSLGLIGGLAYIFIAIFLITTIPTKK